MESISVRQLKEQTSAVLRRVREQREPVEVTYRGRIVARLVPVDSPTGADLDVAAVMRDLDELAEEIGRAWPASVSAVDPVREGRREL